MNVIDGIIIFIFGLAAIVVFLVFTGKFFASAVRDKGKGLWTKFLDLIENLLRWLP
jgi:hypothetical protein